jgi:hypothetical protein
MGVTKALGGFVLATMVTTYAFDGVLVVVEKVSEAVAVELALARVTGLGLMPRVMEGSDGESDMVKVAGPLKPVLPLPLPDSVIVVVMFVRVFATIFVLAGLAASEPKTFTAAEAKWGTAITAAKTARVRRFRIRLFMVCLGVGCVLAGTLR